MIDNENQCIAEHLLNMKDTYLDNKLVFIKKNNNIDEFTYRDVIKRAKEVAKYLENKGLKKGDKVLIESSNISEFVICLYGCIINGIVVTPVNPSEITPIKFSIFNKVDNLISNMDYKGVIINYNEFSKEEIEKLSKKANVIDIESAINSVINEPYLEKHIKLKDPVFIIYTSGSTGSPKGVELTSENILSQIHNFNIQYSITEKDIFLNYFTLEHVVGLIQFTISPMIVGASQIHVETSEIMRNLKKWFEYIDKYKVTNTWAPNFIYSLVCMQKNEIKNANVDLKTIRNIFNCGEAVNYKDCVEFLEMLRNKNLNKNSIKACWGMTETSGIVLLSNYLNEELFNNCISVGGIKEGLEIRIVDQYGKEVEEQKEGILQIKGNMVSSKYYQDGKAINNSIEEWFDTGDCAVVYNDEYYITGRQKDILIKNGININCIDIDKKLMDIAGMKKNQIKSMAIKNEEKNVDELIVFYVEPKDGIREEIVDEINKVMIDNFGFSYNHLISVEEDKFPYTAVGKVDRGALKKNFKENNYLEIFRDFSQEFNHNNFNEDAEKMCAIWKQVLGMDKIPMNISYFQLGGTSVNISYLLTKINEEFKTKVNVADLFKYSSINEMLEFVKGSNSNFEEELIIDI